MWSWSFWCCCCCCAFHLIREEERSFQEKSSLALSPASSHTTQSAAAEEHKAYKKQQYIFFISITSLVLWTKKTKCIEFEWCGFCGVKSSQLNPLPTPTKSCVVWTEHWTLNWTNVSAAFTQLELWVWVWVSYCNVARHRRVFVCFIRITEIQQIQNLNLTKRKRKANQNQIARPDQFSQFKTDCVVMSGWSLVLDWICVVSSRWRVELYGKDECFAGPSLLSQWLWLSCFIRWFYYYIAF